MKNDSDKILQAENIEKYLYHVYLDRINSNSPDSIIVSFDYAVKDWSEEKKITSLSNFFRPERYKFSKTDISGIDNLAIWQDFGFQLDKKNSAKPAGYQNKLFISRLRRIIQQPDSSPHEKADHHKNSKRIAGKLAL